VTVNTDNRLVTDTTVSKELWLCHDQMGFSLDDIKGMIMSGFKAAFLPFHVKQQYLRKVSEELATFNDDGLPELAPPVVDSTPVGASRRKSVAPAPLASEQGES
jgi:adenosine deaminase